MIITTRGLNGELYNRMVEFLPDMVLKYRLCGMDGDNGSIDYLHSILQTDEEWVVNIDEDCFVYDWDMIEQIIIHMRRNNLHYAGMPDGGVCSTRARSWVTMNPFFNIFHVSEIQKGYKKHNREFIDKCEISYGVDYHKPNYIKGKFDHSLISPFNGLFNWLYDYYNPLFLDARDHPDGISTELVDPSGGEGFCLHSWYSREYNNDPKQKERIDSLFSEAALRSKKPMTVWID